MFAANEKVFKLFFYPLFFDSKLQHRKFEIKNKYRVVCIFSSYRPVNETSEHYVLNLVKLI